MNSSDDVDITANDFDDKYTPSLRYIITTIQCIIIVVTLVGNLATITAFYKVRALREKPSDLYILNLSCADLGIGVLFILMVPVHATGRWPWGKILCQTMACVANAFVVAGLLTTLAISIDRYFLISREYPKYVKFQSKQRVYRTLVGLWAYSLVWTVLEWILWDIVGTPEHFEAFNYDVECRSPPKHSLLYSTTAFATTIFVPLISIEILSVVFVIRLRRKLKRRAQVGDFEISNQQSRINTELSRAYHVSRGVVDNGARTGDMGRNENQLGSHNAKNRYVKAAITLGALVATLNICLLPFIVYTLYVGLICPACNSGRMRDILSNVFVNFNSCLNPLLYAATMSKIRNFYKRILCRN